MKKDTSKMIQDILSEYKQAKNKKELQEEQLQDKSVINPEITIKQVMNLKEKDLNIQTMIALIKVQDEIKSEEKKVDTKVKKIKSDIGSFRYEYDENGIATNADDMQKMSQKFEKAKEQMNQIKETKTNCANILLDFEEKTGLTVNNVIEMIEKQERLKREYEEQEKIRKAQREEEKRKEQEEKAKQEELNKSTEAEKIKQNKEIVEIQTAEERDREEIITIFPNQNKAVYLFEGKEGQIDDIRQLIWGDKPKVFGKYKIKEEEYVLTNNNTGEEREYKSKLNPLVFEILKTNPQKLESYMNLSSTTSILYYFDEKSKENKDVAKMMYKYQKEDEAITQKVGSMGLRDKINSRMAYKLQRKSVLMLNAGTVDESKPFTKQEEGLNQENSASKPDLFNIGDSKKTKKQLKAESKQIKRKSKFSKNDNTISSSQEEYNYESTRTKMEAFREQMRASANTNLAVDGIKVNNQLEKEQDVKFKTDELTKD